MTKEDTTRSSLTIPQAQRIDTNTIVTVHAISVETATSHENAQHMANSVKLWHHETFCWSMQQKKEPQKFTQQAIIQCKKTTVTTKQPIQTPKRLKQQQARTRV